MTSSIPIAWTIAGSDSSGGAGIQADIKTMTAFGTHCCTVISAVTAQSTKAVRMFEPVSAALLAAQIETMRIDLPPMAVKLGMLPDSQSVNVVSNLLPSLSTIIVCDPVMVSTSGAQLMESQAVELIRRLIIPECTLVTPNLSEAEILAGFTPTSTACIAGMAASGELDGYMESLGSKILSLGAESALIKGGHCAGNFSQDFYCSASGDKWWLTSQRIATSNTHGTGCTLSAGLTACIAQGYDVLESLVRAKAYVNSAMRLAPGLGGGNGPLWHGPIAFQQSDLPWLTMSAKAGRERPCFPKEKLIGFYPVIDNTGLLKELLPAKISTVQLRIKNADQKFLENEIKTAVRLCEANQCRLYVNDYWESAMANRAYGIHLGQEDLQLLSEQDVKLIADSGIRLGISTHNYTEVARALAFQPSYIAIGPIYATTTKIMTHRTQGLSGLKQWSSMLEYPLVAIGGIFLNDAADMIAAGADGVAVVRDISENANPHERASQWMRLVSDTTTSAHRRLTYAEVPK